MSAAAKDLVDAFFSTPPTFNADRCSFLRAPATSRSTSKSTSANLATLAGDHTCRRATRPTVGAHAPAGAPAA
eukprot:CAMPEP_0184226376 /NCGR_PEP_ID=MMETSP0976-20121227/20720_1 /TAXON_ID=483370 /ORGANISM="non described non described, Strain CCMP2097" /LENGTH=72 /DNA_ID=CAMNT_0026531323 /DNA_START=82 /DNA_END=297 /DNA_ORIENTATION=-